MRKCLWGCVAAICLAGPVFADAKATDAVNALRAKAGKAPVVYSARLEAIAMGHARDMARRGRMTHKSANGDGPGERARAQGYGWCMIAENVAWGQQSLREVMQSWKGSKGHRRNMLQTHATELGVARASGDYWVMVLAKPGC